MFNLISRVNDKIPAIKNLKRPANSPEQLFQIVKNMDMKKKNHSQNEENKKLISTPNYSNLQQKENQIKQVNLKQSNYKENMTQ